MPEINFFFSTLCFNKILILHFTGSSSGFASKAPELRILTKSEVDQELSERWKRSNHLLVNDDLGRSLEDIRKLVNSCNKWDDCTWTLIRKTGENEWLVNVDNCQHKRVLVWNRNWYHSYHCVYFRDHHTPRQKEVHWWLRIQAEIEKQKGNKVKVNDSNIKINGLRKVWDERRGELVLKTEGADQSHS